jgi:hypothetical protein
MTISLDSLPPPIAFSGSEEVALELSDRAEAWWMIDSHKCLRTGEKALLRLKTVIRNTMPVIHDISLELS